jgi:hypothetical protein
MGFVLEISLDNPVAKLEKITFHQNTGRTFISSSAI